jgi:hypothetical protein
MDQPRQVITVVSDGSNWEMINNDDDSYLGVTSVGATADIGVYDGPVIDVTTGGIEITLPGVAVAGIGQTYIVKDSDGNASGDPITVAGATGENIDASNTASISTDYDSLSLVNLGDKWIIT